MKVLTRENELRELSRDSGILEIRPRAAYVASSEEEVLEALSTAKAEGLGITPRGSGTGIPSQSVGRGAILLQDRRGATIDHEGNAVCEPALLKGELNSLLDAGGRWVPVDPSSYLTCSVGGMVSNNSSGARSFKYGSTIDYVQGLRVVLPEEGPVDVKPVAIEDAISAGGTIRKIAELLLDHRQSIARDTPKVTKNSSGYRLEKVLHDGLLDLPRLFVGSEGTLGVVTLVSLRTRLKPKTKTLLIFEAGLKELDGLAASLRSHSPSAIELIDKSVFRQTGRSDRIRPISRSEEPYLVFAELDSDADIVPTLEKVATDPGIARFEPITLTDPGQIAKAWEVRNETLTFAADMKKGPRSPVPGVEDVVVPQARLGDIIRFLADEFEGRGLDYISYGHAGDANLHMRPLLDGTSSADLRMLKEIMDESFEQVWKMGGSMTGEHGDGMLRAPYLQRQYPHSYDVMVELKRFFDPDGLMNPGVKFP